MECGGLIPPASFLLDHRRSLLTDPDSIAVASSSSTLDPHRDVLPLPYLLPIESSLLAGFDLQGPLVSLVWVETTYII